MYHGEHYETPFILAYIQHNEDMSLENLLAKPIVSVIKTSNIT